MKGMGDVVPHGRQPGCQSIGHPCARAGHSDQPVKPSAISAAFHAAYQAGNVTGWPMLHAHAKTIK